MKLLVAAVCLAASACAMNAAAPDASRGISIDKRYYAISQLTAGTWIASSTGAATAITLDTRSALLAAIEKASGCKVTDSDLSRQGLQLDAQVDCGSQLQN